MITDPVTMTDTDGAANAVTDGGRQLPASGAPGGAVEPVRRSRLRRWAIEVPKHLLVLAIVVGTWELISAQGWVSERMLPRPSDIAVAFGDIVTSGILWPHLRATLYAGVVGFLIGSGLAFVMAAGAALSPQVRRFVYPYVVAFQVMPRIVVAPILFIWLGFGTSPKVVLTATICFFPVFVNTMTGIASTDKDMLELFRSLRASPLQVFFRLRLPAALPIIFAGVKTAVSFALVGAVVGEFISAQEGLGLLTERFSFQLQMDYAFAVFVVLMIGGLVLYGAVELAERQLVYWTHDERLHRRTRRQRTRLEAELAR